MLEKDINDLLQDYKYRKNILEEITLDDIDRWNNIDVDVGWDKILNKPTTLEGYGITDAYTKEEIKYNTLNKYQATSGDFLVDLGFSIKNSGYEILGINTGSSGAPTVKFGLSYDSDMYSHIDSYLGNLDLIASGQINIRTPYLNLKVPSFSLSGGNGGFSVDVSDTYANNKVFASIPVEFTNSFKSPRINIYGNNNTVFEGSLYNSTYNINGVIHDGLHLRHEDGKYLVLGYTDSEKNKVYSYMICDVDGVLKNESDGDDWAPIRFEQSVFCRGDLKMGSFTDISMDGGKVGERLSALENAIKTGTGMVEWSNVLNKPTTFTPSSHGHSISDITNLQNSLDGKLSTTGGAVTGNINFENAKAIRGKDISGNYQDLIKSGMYTTTSGSTNATLVGNTTYPTIVFGGLYEGNYKTLNSNNFTDYCPKISDLDSYLPLSGGIMNGNLRFDGVDGHGINFWNSNLYSIYMSSADDSTYGGRLWEISSDYNMYFKMQSGTNRGFVFKNGDTVLGGMDGSGTFRALKMISTKDIYFGSGTTTDVGYFKDGELTFSNSKGIYGKDTNGTAQRIAVVGADNCCYLGGVYLHTYIRSSDTPQYLTQDGKKYNLFHEGYTQKWMSAYNSSTVSSDITTPQLLYTGPISKDKSGLFPAITNANSILNIGRHNKEDGCYESQLGFSSNGRLYYRIFENENPSSNPTKSWNTIAFSSDLSAYALLGHQHDFIASMGRSAPKTGRNARKGVYCYTTSGADSTSTGMPSGYCTVIGFGDGDGGCAEIAISYTGNGMWYRYLRDWQDNWSSWVQIK